jgi:ATP/maltotriose-dependent transcriptional regulator MalT
LLLALDFAGQPLEQELRAAERSLAARDENTLGTRLVAGMLADAAAKRGRPRSAVLTLAARAVADDAMYASDLEAGYPHMYALGALAIAEEPVLAEQRLTEAAERAGRRGSRVGAGIAHYLRAKIRLRRGLLAEAEDDARNGLELAATISENWLIAPTAATLVRALVERGDLEAANSVMERHRLEHEPLAGLPLPDASLACSQLRLATGRADDALANALAAGRLAETLSLRNPLLAPWRSRAALALIALGRPAEARELMTTELTIATAADLPSAIGSARRVLALATGGDAAIAMLQDAAAALEQTPAPLEFARALADLGAALRRAGRRQAARAPLRRALEIAHRHGAALLADTALVELRAAGARPRRVVRSGVDALTPSELRIAQLAATGLSNADIAAFLFITSKTVEHHLAAVYRKLDIPSRRKLPAALITTRHPSD